MKQSTPFDAGTALINSTNRGTNMRKAIALVLLIVIGTIPLHVSAQAQTFPAVDLHCLNTHGDVYNNDAADENSTHGILALINSSEDEPSTNVTCTVSNPNSYVERVSIEVDADGLAVQTNGTITLPANGQKSFNITVSANQNMLVGTTVLEVTARVVEANGVPPPNVAEDYVEGIVWIVNYELLISSSIEITEIGPYRSSIEYHAMENGTEYPVLYLKESFHIDAIMTAWDEQPIANKCLNLYVDPEENPLPIATINTSENGTVEWYSSDPLQNPSLKGVEITAGKLEGLRTLRVAYEPEGGEPSGCETDSSGNQSSTYADVEVLVRSRTDIMLKQSWGYFDADSVDVDGDGLHDSVEEYGIRDGEEVNGEVVLLRDRLDLAVVNESILFKFYYYSTSEESWIFDHDELHLTNPQGIAELSWSAKLVSDDDCSNVSCIVKWKITALHPGSELFSPAVGNYTFELIVLPPIVDSDGDGVEDDEDAFPDDPDETHDDDGDGVGNNTDEFPQDPDEQFDKDGDGVGDNEDDFPDNKYASNWSTIYAAFGTLIVLLIGAGVIISRMKKEDELPNVPASNELDQLEKQIKELEKKKSEVLGEQDPTELMFED